MKKEKALSLAQSMFLGKLQLSVLSSFDPRGDETLAALQTRLAQEHVPHQVPDSSDLSPMLELFREDIHEYAHSGMLSEVLAAMTYDKIAKTDLRDKEEVQRLGKALRGLFEQEMAWSLQDLESMCGTKISSEALQRVYSF